MAGEGAQRLPIVEPPAPERPTQEGLAVHGRKGQVLLAHLEVGAKGNGGVRQRFRRKGSQRQGLNQRLTFSIM